MQPTPYAQIARVVKTHGTRGELAVASLGGALEDLPQGLEVWFVPPPEHPLCARLLGVRQGPKGPLATFEGIDSPESARALAGAVALARRSDLPEEWLPEEELDVSGFIVLDEERGPLGEVAETIFTGANDVWVVAGGSVGEVLIPVIEDVIISIDESTRTIRVNLLPGLIAED
jgi:16S rRNA processing protein RimM